MRSSRHRRCGHSLPREVRRLLCVQVRGDRQSVRFWTNGGRVAVVSPIQFGVSSQVTARTTPTKSGCSEAGTSDLCTVTGGRTYGHAEQQQSPTVKGLIPHFYSVALEIPGMSRPVTCLVTAFSRSDALRQARGMLSGIKVRVMPPGH